DSHPHIGSNKLPKIVENIRQTIENNGGLVKFDAKVTDLIIKGNEVKGVIVNDESEYIADSVILATGHSARDIYSLLKSRGITIEQKSFAIGVRIEHPQELIDQIQYHSKNRHVNLPAANYRLSCQVDDKGVYSFCMCPGGLIVPASTDQNEIVINGMSISRRDSPYANSGIVVTVDETDWHTFNNHGVFAGLEFQKDIERKFYNLGGSKLTAPSQRVTDFVSNKLSESLPETSYIPGVRSVLLSELLPPVLSKALSSAFKIFNRRMKGFITEEAQILAPESRTSSPIRILRDDTTLMHVNIQGLFPSGEGAGYAGGIVSSAIDGERCALAAVNYLSMK
ncbi:NAD(P)/FAD-dependent oxidoreductase, partial [Bacteroidota bacterium]